VDALEALGAEALVYPTIAVEAPEDPGPLRRAVDALPSYDWLVLTSPNGVEWFWRALETAGRDAAELEDLRVACVGRATAEAVEARGLTVDVVPSDQHGEGLLEAMLDAGGLDGARVLLPRAAVARDVLPDGLEAAGARVDDVAAYRTVPNTEGAQAMRRELAAGRIDVVTFTSPSSARSFVDAVGRELHGAKVAVIGPVTGRAARELGLEVAVEASDHSIPGLVRAVAGLYGGSTEGEG